MHGFAKNILAVSQITPHAIAVIDGSRTVTYADLLNAATRISQALRERDLPRNARVMVQGQRGPLYYASLLGCWLEGASVIAETADLSKTRTANIEKTLSPACSISMGAASDKGQQIETALGSLNLESMGTGLSPAKTEAYIVTTSGSTGAPKFVKISPHALDCMVEAATKVYPLALGDRTTQVFEQVFDLFFYDLLVTLTNGATLVVIPQDQFWNAFRLCQEHQITQWFSTPSMAQLLERAGALPPLSSLRRVLFCGEALPTHLALRWAAQFPKAQIVNYYGPAEATVVCTHHEFRAERDQRHNIVPIGRPLSCTRTMVLDQSGKLHDTGEGELCIAGTQIMNGYDSVPASVPSPLFEQENLTFYKTGDLVRITSDEPITFLGRLGRQFKYLGRRVEPEAIEAVLKSHHSVQGAAVLPDADAAGRVVGINAFVSLHCKVVSQTDETQQVLLDFLEEVLGKTLKPTRLTVLDDLPYNSSGKVDYSNLRKRTDGDQPREDALNMTTDDDRQLNMAGAIDLVASALEISQSDAKKVSGIFDHPRWDSLGHIAVTEQVSEALKRPIAPDQCLNIERIANLLAGHLVSANSTPADQIRRGLYGVILDRTSICEIDTKAMRISFRGISLNALAQDPFLSNALLLNTGVRPNQLQLDTARNSMAVGWRVAADGLPLASAHDPNGPDRMSSALSTLSHKVNEVALKDPIYAGSFAQGICLYAIGCHVTHRNIAQTLVSTFIEKQTDASSGVLDATNKALTIFAEHGACASTTTLRCVASTGSGLAQSLVAAMSAFVGPQHGGALYKIATGLGDNSIASIEAYGRAAVNDLSQDRIPFGFGHRLYQSEDPRVQLFRDVLIQDLGRGDLVSSLDKISREVSRASHERLSSNVDLYGASALLAISFKAKDVLSVYTIARMAGWVAHYFEQSRNNTLIRPNLKYDPDFDQGTRMD